MDIKNFIHVKSLLLKYEMQLYHSSRDTNNTIHPLTSPSSPAKQKINEKTKCAIALVQRIFRDCYFSSNPFSRPYHSRQFITNTYGANTSEIKQMTLSLVSLSSYYVRKSPQIMFGLCRWYKTAIPLAADTRILCKITRGLIPEVLAYLPFQL